MLQNRSPLKMLMEGHWMERHTTELHIYNIAGFLITYGSNIVNKKLPVSHCYNTNEAKRILFLMKFYCMLPLCVDELQRYMSHDVRKPVFGVSDQVRHKPGCAITEYD